MNQVRISTQHGCFPSCSKCKIMKVTNFQNTLNDTQSDSYSFFTRKNIKMQIEGYTAKYHYLNKFISIPKTDFDILYKNIVFKISVDKNTEFDSSTKYGGILFDQISKDVTDFEYIFNKKIEKTDYKLSNKEKFIKYFLRVLLINLYKNNQNIIDSFLERTPHNVFNSISEKQPNDYGTMLFSILSSFMSHLYNYTGNSEAPAVLKYLERLYKLFVSLEDKYYSEDKIIIKITGKSIDSIKDIIKTLDDYKFLSKQDKIDSHNSQTEYDIFSEIKYDFYYLSTGERQYLDLLSAIEVSLRGIFKGTKNIVLLLDEPDNFMHPETARSFIFHINSILSKVKDLDFQVIISTHSPFLLSDIPSSSIIRMKKNEKSGDCIKCETNNETFGANIHTILSEDFFMDSTIGKFAENYIKELISDISNINGNTDNISELVNDYRDRIEIIGEKIIRHRLHHLLSSQLDASQNVDLQIKHHENIIAELRKKKELKEKDNDKN